MTKLHLVTGLLAMLIAACSPYVAPRLPIGEGSALSYRIIPIRADTAEKWAAPAAIEPAISLSSSSSASQTDYDYILGPGDLIRLIIYTFDATGQQSAIRVFPEGLPIAGEDEFLVAANGTVTLPYAGRMQVAGKPFARVERMIGRRLKRYFINPQFQARVSQFGHGRVLVTGELSTPGEQLLSHAPLTVTQAIQAAGGLLPTADLSTATLTRSSGEIIPLNLTALYFEGNDRANLILQPGDQLTVPRGHANQLFITGEVVRPQVVTMHPRGFSLTEALQQVGGINPVTGDPSQIYVLRLASDRQTAKAHLHIYHLNAANLAYYTLADRFTMQPRDIIYVSMQPVTQWERIISQFLPGGLSTIIGPQND